MLRIHASIETRKPKTSLQFIFEVLKLKTLINRKQTGALKNSIVENAVIRTTVQDDILISVVARIFIVLLIGFLDFTPDF